MTRPLVVASAGSTLVEVLVATSMAATFLVLLASGAVSAMHVRSTSAAVRATTIDATTFVTEPTASAASWTRCDVAEGTVPCVTSVERCRATVDGIDCPGAGSLVRLDVRVPGDSAWSPIVTLWRWDP